MNCGKIDTVFYFSDDLSLQDYRDMVRDGQIELRTIVFAERQRAIYKGGKMYSPMEDETFKEILLRMLQDADIMGPIIDLIANFYKTHPNELPIATRSTLGAIIVGFALSIANDGTLNVDTESLFSDPSVIDRLKNIIRNYYIDNPYNLPIATASKLGAIRVGSGLDITEEGVLSASFLDPDDPDLLNAILNLFRNASSIRASYSNYGIVKVKQNGGIVVYNGEISLDPSYVGTSSGADGKNYAITNFTSTGSILSISQNNNATKSVDIKDAVKSSVQQFIDNGDTIINQFGSGSIVKVRPILTSGLHMATINVDGTDYKLYCQSGGGSGSGSGSGSDGSSGYDDTDVWNEINGIKDRLNTKIDFTDAWIKLLIASAFSRFLDLINLFPEGGSWDSFTFGNKNLDQWLSEKGILTYDQNTGMYKAGWSTLTQTVSDLEGRVQQVEGQVGSGGDINYQLLSSGLYSYIRDNYTTAGMDSTWAKFMELDSGDILTLKWMSSGVKTYANDSETYANLMAAARDYNEKGNIITQGIADIQALVERKNGKLVATSNFDAMVDNSIAGMFATGESSNAVSALYSNILNKYATVTTAVTKNPRTNELDSNIRLTADKVTIDGDLIADAISANDLELTNKITARDMHITGGTIGGFDINENRLYINDHTYDGFGTDYGTIISRTTVGIGENTAFYAAGTNNTIEECKIGALVLNGGSFNGSDAVSLPGGVADGYIVFCPSCGSVSASSYIYSQSGERYGTSKRYDDQRARIFVFGYNSSAGNSVWTEFYCS